MRFLYEQYARYRDDGMAAYRRSALGDARYNLLRAAEFLFKLAHLSTGEMRASRLRSADRLVALASSIDSSRPAQEGRRPAECAADGAGAESRPSRWEIAERPGVGFDDIAGLVEVKEVIRRRVLYPLQYPEATARYRKRTGGGVLLYGPPGTGKTMLAKAMASELDAAFFSVKCSDIMSKWVGEAERNLKELFAEARSRAVSVVFLDETEALVGRRGGDSTIMNRVIPEFLAQVDGIDTGGCALLLLGATNRPWDMDEAALRPGRFGERIFVPLPDEDARRQILAANLEGVPMAPEVDIDVLARQTEGYSGADLVGVVARATDQPYSREVATGTPDRVTLEDLTTALAHISPSVTAAMMERFGKFRRLHV